MQINTNNYSIIELLQMLDRKELVVNKEYQRGSGIWPKGPSSYFIDTILEGFPFPKIYMYEFLNMETREMRKEIVDGQQRIGTIQRFYHNKLSLIGDTKYAGKKFSDLEDELQQSFLSYTLSVDVIRSARKGQILQMFRRMNAYTMPLNESEKRHSRFQGKFKWFVNQLSDELSEFFTEYKVLTNRQIVRMSDAALLSDIILAFEKGIISSSPNELNKLYTRYDEEFAFSEEYKNQIMEAVEFITQHLEVLRKTHMMKPYAFHSLMTALVFNRFGNTAIETEFNIRPLGRFAADNTEAAEKLLAMAQAHEAKEIEGPYDTYVWGSLSTTDRKLRRTARTCSILRALGVAVPREIDGNLT